VQLKIQKQMLVQVKKQKQKLCTLKEKNIYSQMIHKIFIGSNKKLAQVEKFTTLHAIQI